MKRGFFSRRCGQSGIEVGMRSLLSSLGVRYSLAAKEGRS